MAVPAAALSAFHPEVAAWFSETLGEPTPAQAEAWPKIAAGRHTLIAAPTGSGKTLAAFMAAIDELVRAGLAGQLRDETAVIYVSPLKALSNDIQINLTRPLEGIRERLEAAGLPPVEIRVAVRTGDTPAAERTAMRKMPPHVIVTTPESLYILLGSPSGRTMLATARTLIVDEIHALLPSKRGSHLALSIERLEALCGRRLQRIGLSATQKPLARVAEYLLGDTTARQPSEDLLATNDAVAIVDSGHQRQRDLALETVGIPLEAVLSGEAWQLIYDRLVGLAGNHRTTLVFVNTRRMAERVARHLSERIGTDKVAAHHGSLAREQRLDAEQRLKRGELSILVATASLELGIDIGDVDLVCQLGSPRAINAFLQRVGRARHAVHGTPKGRLFPTSRDDLVECVAILDAVRRGELDVLRRFDHPLDVLAQQLVAEVGCRDAGEDELFALVRRAQPYATLSRKDFDDVVAMLAAGISTRRGPRAALVHHDTVRHELRARKGTRLTALTSGGAIPDTADYDVVLEPQGQKIGTLHEDFAIESMAGDIFQLGNASYRVLRVERGRVRVEDAQGLPPSIPFWIGEAPGRTDELSVAVSRLRQTIEDRLDDSLAAALAYLTDEVGIVGSAAEQLVDYLAAARTALGMLPTRERIVFERFFDESGGTQLVIHSPYGSRLNRAWGLALRKRFCKQFNFELQAAATEDAIILSLSLSHSFPLLEVSRYLHSASVREVLVQALLTAPMFGARWRWNANVSLALPRFVGGSKVPPQLMRMKSEDLLAAVFPDQVACAENLAGEREVPDHPLVAQTLSDCLTDAMDIEGLEALLKQLESGAIEVIGRDLTEPSPLAAEILGSRPYTFLDDAPLEERRTQAVMTRRSYTPSSVADFGRLDAAAISAVREEAWPSVGSTDELHEVLHAIAYVTDRELDAAPHWRSLADALAGQGRALWVALPDGQRILSVIERRAQWRAIYEPATAAESKIADADAPTRASACGTSDKTPLDDRESALVDVLRARLTALGPVTATELAASLSLPPLDVDLALLALEREGFAMRGQYSEGAGEEWCERHLLARIHRYTVGRLRREIEPVDTPSFVRFLFDWQKVGAGARMKGPEALANVLSQLEGYEAPAVAWEADLLPSRLADYQFSWLDDLIRAGRISWARLAPRSGKATAQGPVRATPIVFVARRALPAWRSCAAGGEAVEATLTSRAQAVQGFLAKHGASFFDEIEDGTRLLRVDVEIALGELVAQGLVHADSFSGLRALLVPAEKRQRMERRSRGRSLLGVESAGRWALTQRGLIETPATSTNEPDDEAVEAIAWTLLRRYGVVAWRLLEREADWLPPWRRLLRVYQRLEARGEIRGGRFVDGLWGEQFALPDAVAALRKQRNRAPDGKLVSISAADPLNLVGGLIAGARIPALAGNRILFRDGVPVATLVGGDTVYIATPAEGEAWSWRMALIGRTASAAEIEIPAAASGPD